MKKTIFTTKETILVLAILGGAIYLVLKILALVDPAITVTILSVLVGLGATLYTQSQIKSREADEAHRPKKIELYNGFIKLIQRMHVASNKNMEGDPVSEKELLEYMSDFKSDLILWSSPGVITAFSDAFEKDSSKKLDILLDVDILYREMRKDIGLSNRGLSENALIKTYLKDPTELDEVIENK